MKYDSIATITLNHEYVNAPCDWAEIIPSDETKKFLQQEQLIVKINGNTIFILGDRDAHINAIMEFFFCVRIKNQNVGTATSHKKHDEEKPPVYALFGDNIKAHQKKSLITDKAKYPFFKTKTCFGIDLKLLVIDNTQTFDITLKSQSAYWRYRFLKSSIESIKDLEIIDKSENNETESDVKFHCSAEDDTYVFKSQNKLPLSLAPKHHFHLIHKNSKKDLFGCLPNLDTRYLKSTQIKSSQKDKLNDLTVEYFFNH